jgi:PAS domain S-box-containing protein
MTDPLIAPGVAGEVVSAISTAELSRRPSRSPDYLAENRALVALAQKLATSPDGILQEVAHTALSLCRAQSSGLSLLEDEDNRENFHWRAIAGEWASHLGGGTPRNFGPCGTVLDRNVPLLFSHPERDFPYFGKVAPLLEEALLAPFYLAGEAVGTIWVVLHDESRRFDTEDLRVLTNLGAFAAAAYQAMLTAKSKRVADQEAQQVGAAMQRLAFIVESSNDAIVSKSLDGTITSWNKGAEYVFGYTAEEIIGKPITTLMTPDRYEEEKSILQRLRRGERVEPFETIRRRKDGRLIHVSVTMSPIKNAEGKIVGASKIARDITESKQAQETQALLLGEMRHRVNNLFAVTNALVGMSARSARTPQEMAAAIQARLAALNRAHGLTRPSLIDTEAKARRTMLSTLIRAIFAPYANEGSEGPERIVITGCDLPIDEKAITSVALVLHELATNAAKYGALATATGVVHIDCALAKDELFVTWKERGGPSINGDPDQEGFGGKLARQIIAHQFGGKIFNEWNPGGLFVHLTLPLKHLLNGQDERRAS